MGMGTGMGTGNQRKKNEGEETEAGGAEKPAEGRTKRRRSDAGVCGRGCGGGYERVMEWTRVWNAELMEHEHEHEQEGQATLGSSRSMSVSVCVCASL